ncbi:MAG: hypothetical protein H7257_06325 [Taibaiella sp.]|nr:hypothetical protein [Taibaiella sp.]
MGTGVNKRIFLLAAIIFAALGAMAQGDTKVSARLDTRQIIIGDQARLFLEAQHNPASGRLQWPALIDTFNKLEIVEKGKIDTINNGSSVTYRQRLLITGFDSGLFKVPPFQFTIIPQAGAALIAQTDSFQLLVQTVAVDTTKGFKPIKNIIFVKPGWLDYLWYIIAAVVFIALLIFVFVYFIKSKKIAIPKPQAPEIPLQDRTLNLLNELDGNQLWQKNQVKEYYVELTDIVRNYIEQRFRTPALELTTDELLDKAKMHRELLPYVSVLTVILQTADLAKFAKWQPLPQEHMDAIDNARKFVDTSRPVKTEPTTEKKI